MKQELDLTESYIKILLLYVSGDTVLEGEAFASAEGNLCVC
jgi:hypothetical protein